MADRWEERSRGDIRDDRNYRGRDRDDRGMMDRAGDEVRSWFGDEDAARRRRMDEVREERLDRDWRERASTAAARGWDQTRDTVRDVTDRDRDGRRGLAEWSDNDRPSNRAYGYGTRSYTDEPSARTFGDTSRYATADPYTSSRWSTQSPGVAWDRPNYVGRGPRGYRRGDERIREDVCDRLTDDPRVDASDVDVQINNGEVTLSGSVRTRQEKRITEDLIENITGVREVNNNLKVKPPDEVIGTARSGASMLGLSDTPPPSTKSR
jgi:osmotically-inducible protein OsmY